MMEHGSSEEDIVRAFAAFLKKPEEELRPRFDAIFRTLYDEGFLIAEEP